MEGGQAQVGEGRGQSGGVVLCGSSTDVGACQENDVSPGSVAGQVYFDLSGSKGFIGHGDNVVVAYGDGDGVAELNNELLVDLGVVRFGHRFWPDFFGLLVAVAIDWGGGRA